MEDKRTEQYRQELKEFVMSHTEDVLKNPRSFIRYPFIDPGSVYDGNVWDWDTYWSVYGFLNLADSYQDPSVKPRIIEHAQGNIRNFFDHQLEDGYIPMMIEVADWPEPFFSCNASATLIKSVACPSSQARLKSPALLSPMI